MKYWLMKCEPAAYTIDDLQRDGTTSWEGVRSYQARNFMRDEMRPGDKVLFYASPLGTSEIRIAYVLKEEDLRTAVRLLAEALKRYQS